MEITKSNRIIINEIMYSLSTAITSFHGDDSITAQLLHCFQSYLLSDFSDKKYYKTDIVLFQHISIKIMTMQKNLSFKCFKKTDAVGHLFFVYTLLTTSFCDFTMQSGGYTPRSEVRG